MQTRWCATLAMLMAVNVLPARGDDAAVRRAIEAQMAKFQQAFRRKDMASLRTITTSDFTMKSKNGKVSSRREAEIVLAAELKRIQEIKEWTLKIERLTVKGNVATAIVNERLVARLPGESGRSTTEVSTTRMREVWVNTPAGWRYKRAEALSATSGPANMRFVASDQLDTKRPEYAAARKAIEAQYVIYQNAVRRKDLRAALATMTDDMTIVYPNGRTFDRKMTERSLQQTIDGLRTIKQWSIKVAHLTVGKTGAIATVGERLVSTFADYSGKVHSQTLVDFYQDTWVKTPKGWRLRNTQMLRGTVTVDGKSGDPFR